MYDVIFCSEKFDSLHTNKYSNYFCYSDMYMDELVKRNTKSYEFVE